MADGKGGDRGTPTGGETVTGNAADGELDGAAHRVLGKDVPAALEGLARAQAAAGDRAAAEASRAGPARPWRGSTTGRIAS